MVKSYLEKYNRVYFTYSPNSEKPMNAVIRHLHQDTPAEDISNSLEELGFNVISVKQLVTNRRAPTGQTRLETLPLFLVTLIRNIISQEIFKLNSLNHIITKVEPYRSQILIKKCYTVKALAMSGTTAINTLDACGVVVATCIGNVLKRRMQNLCRAVVIASW
jgi:hypothetical protein